CDFRGYWSVSRTRQPIATQHESILLERCSFATSNSYDRLHVSNGGTELMNQNLLRPTAFLGTVAAILAITVVLTLSYATHLVGSIGSLKCYDAEGGKEKAC